MNHAFIGSPTLDLTPYLVEGTADLGPLVVRHDIKSHIGPFNTFPQYRTVYPPVVVQALLELYFEYNGHFSPLVAANREWDTDYQYCFEAGTPLNRWVQIDMVGLPQQFLDVASAFSVEEVKAALRRHIFEIENSLAMYQLLERITPSRRFHDTFRASLDELRQRYGKPIALLAVTDHKYEAMLADEFGKWPDEAITDAEVLELSGFDRLFSPDQFRAHVAELGGQCGYLLYVRSSDPTAKLKDPERTIEHPLLSEPELRRIIRAHSLTFNIDNPSSPPERRINDTKAYMASMGMAHVIRDEEDLFNPACYAFIKKTGRPVTDWVPNEINTSRLHPKLVAYLRQCGVDERLITWGDLPLRLKPQGGTYGCYGHHTFSVVGKAKKRQNFRRDLKLRGAYVVQPELPTPYIVDPHTGKTYGYIDRNFVTMLNDKPVFMGGFRSMLPLVSEEAQKGRFHGNEETVWGAIDAMC